MTTATPPGGLVLPSPDEIEVCIAASCDVCDFAKTCEDNVGEPIHKCHRCGLHFGGEDTNCPRCDWPEPLPCSASNQCVYENCRHFWYEGCDAGCNLKCSPFYRPWPYGDDPDDYDTTPTYCTMAEWSSRCIHNETGHTNYCAEVCELSPSDRVVE